MSLEDMTFADKIMAEIEEFEYDFKKTTLKIMKGVLENMIAGTSGTSLNNSITSLPSAFSDLLDMNR